MSQDAEPSPRRLGVAEDVEGSGGSHRNFVAHEVNRLQIDVLNAMAF